MALARSILALRVQTLVSAGARRRPHRVLGRSFSPLAWYNRQLERSPIITKCITSGGRVNTKPRPLLILHVSCIPLSSHPSISSPSAPSSLLSPLWSRGCPCTDGHKEERRTLRPPPIGQSCNIWHHPPRATGSLALQFH